MHVYGSARRIEIPVKSETRIGVTRHTEESKCKLRMANLGRKHSAETRAKLSAAQRAYRRRVQTLLDQTWQSAQAHSKRMTVAPPDRILRVKTLSSDIDQ